MRIPRVEIGVDDLSVESRLENAIDWDLLVEAGWVEQSLSFFPDPADPIFGYEICRVDGCANTFSHGSKYGVCSSCSERYHLQVDRDGLTISLEEFASTRVKHHYRLKEKYESHCAVCRVDGHLRPAQYRSLCIGCNTERIERGQSITKYVKGDGGYPPASPKVTLGSCTVDGCDRLAADEKMFCVGHRANWIRAGSPEGDDLRSFLHLEVVYSNRKFKESVFTQDRQISPTVKAARGVCLGPLSERLRLEMLLGIQAVANSETKTDPSAMVTAIRWVNRQEVESVALIRKVSAVQHARGRQFVRLAIAATYDAMADPEREMKKDIWKLAMLGVGGGRLDFTGIELPWLRESVKCWASQKVASVHDNSCRRVVASIGELSNFLALRVDRGLNQSALGRKDALGFINWTRGRIEAGQVSNNRGVNQIRDVAIYLREGRSFSIEGDPLLNLPSDFIITKGDTRRLRMEENEDRKDLPQVVVEQLLSEEYLLKLESFAGSSGRACIEIQADIGRRTGEVARLRLNCLEYDAEDEPVLVMDLPKSKTKKFRLPISSETAELIVAQKRRVLDAFPQTDPDQLPLFPRVTRNPTGRNSFQTTTVSAMIRDWMQALPDLQGPNGEIFPKDRVIPYAFRHTYAQRHADAGTPIDVLRDLMGHKSLDSTRGYYIVADKRRRAAVETLAPLQVVAPGAAASVVQEMVSSAQLRRAVGEVAVPFGRCTEPSNVKAKGGSCPFRFRCGGCDHFRTDPSYLPEIKTHLQDLLKSRELLKSKVPALADWARKDALPSDDEIEVFRRLVRSCEEALQEADDDARELIEEAMTILRRTRVTRLVDIASDSPLNIRQVRPTLNPRAKHE